MTEKKEEIDRARKEKLKPKQFVKNPIDIHWALYFSIGINALPSLLFGFSFKFINFGREGP